MSLSEQDREILLQEIQQIQKTLEATGRNFGAEEDNESSSDEEDEDDDNGSNHYHPTYLKQEENFEDKDGEGQGTSSNYTDYITEDNSESQRGLNAGCEERKHVTGTNIISDVWSAENSMVTNHDQSHDPTNLSGVNTPTRSSLDGLVIGSEYRPKSSISAKLKKRIKQESGFGSKSHSKSKGKGKRIHSNDSMDTSSVKSHSLPTKQMEKINMANLYVERLFGGFRNKKSRQSLLTAVDDDKYGGKDLKSSANLSTLENLLQVNRRYKELLSDELKKVELAIARNKRAQDEVVTSMQEKDVKNGTFTSLSKACIGRFGNPYFKDNKGVGPPDNEDTIDKKKIVKVDPFLRGGKHWKNTETAALEEGVYHNNLEKRLEPWMKKLKQFDREYKEKQKLGEKMDKGARHQINKEIACIKELPRSEILLDPSQIDFFKISKNFLSTRDEFECRVQWCNVAHPSINQTKFSKDEDEQLIKLAKKYNNHLWENIAKDLGTNRTPIQCLQRFQRTLNRDMLKTVWEADDDEMLRRAVSMYGQSWVLVASALGNRTGDQCMHRWLKTLDPHIKRGAWSEEEDKCLLDAVGKCGKGNWKEVKKYVKGRTDAQCRERFVATLDPLKDWGPFTEGEDKRIIELVKIHGLGKWSTIAKHFPNRRDNQIWRRYTQIESEKYHKYRRGVIWKRRSVMNYFFHRSSEKRDYSLEELDVKCSPSLTHMESRKIQRTREELVRCGYTEDEITKKLARMHYEGRFSKSIYKPRQRPHSQGRTPGKARKKDSAKLSLKKLVTDITDVLASVKDPCKELPPPPVEPLKRKIKGDRDVNIDGYHIINRPEDKKQGRKDKWLENKVNGDVFRRKCHEVFMKLKTKALWYEDAKKILDEYYSLVQVDGNSFYHKQILNIYTEMSSKLLGLYQTHKEIEKKLISGNEIPIVIEEESFPLPKFDKSSRKVTRNSSTKSKKMSTFKRMVLESSKIIKKEPEDETQNSIRTNAIRFPSSVSGGRLHTTIPHQEKEVIVDTSTNDIYPSISSSSSVNSVDTLTIPSSCTQTPICPTPQRFNSLITTPIPMGKGKNDQVPHVQSNITSHISEIEDENSVSSIPQSQNHHQVYNNRISNENVTPSHPIVTAPINLKSKNSAFIVPVRIKREIGNEMEEPTQPSLSHEIATPSISHAITPSPPQPKTSTLPPPTTPLRQDQGELLMSDKLKTFTLLLQALHVDTTGVMNSLSRSNDDALNTGMLSNNSFPTCYPLSPNAATLLGFRKLLLHRRILGEIVKQHKENSERLGIPVARDLSYQNTKSYDALKKRFRSLFTWPAFLATFTPKYIEQPTSKSSRKRQRYLPQTIPQSISTSSCSNVSLNSASTSTSLSVIPSKKRKNLVVNQSENENGSSPEKNETSTSSFIDDYIKKRKLDTETKMKKMSIKEKEKESLKRTLDANSLNPVVVITPCKKPCNRNNEKDSPVANSEEDSSAGNSDEDLLEEVITKHASQHLPQNDQQKTLKNLKGRKVKDDRQNNSQTDIFIPPVFAVKVETLEQN